MKHGIRYVRYVRYQVKHQSQELDIEGGLGSQCSVHLGANSIGVEKNAPFIVWSTKALAQSTGPAAVSGDGPG